MTKEIDRKINEQVTRYKNSLAFYAKICEWDVFADNAGKLFDYLESVEMSEFESKFFSISKVVATVLVLAVLFIIKFSAAAYPELLRFKEVLILFAIGGCCFEVYFLYNFRMYKKGKTIYYAKRRGRFIQDIKRDFREVIIPSIALNVVEVPSNASTKDSSVIPVA